MATSTVQTTTVFVSNLAFKTTEAELLEEFKKFGTLDADIKVVIRRQCRSVGYCVIGFTNESDAKKAVDGLNNKNLNGFPLKVELNKPRQDQKTDQQTS